MVSLHKGSLQGFFAECISISPAKAMLMCKACTPSSPHTSSIIWGSHAISSLPTGRRETSVYEVFQERTHMMQCYKHTPVKQNLTLPTAHIHNKTSDFHSSRRLKHVTPNSEFSCRIREHENDKKLKNSTLKSTSLN